MCIRDRPSSLRKLLDANTDLMLVKEGGREDGNKSKGPGGLKAPGGAKNPHFLKYLAPSGAKYCEKGLAASKMWRGSIGKPILGLLTFGSNPHFCDFGSK